MRNTSTFKIKVAQHVPDFKEVLSKLEDLTALPLTSTSVDKLGIKRHNADGVLAATPFRVSFNAASSKADRIEAPLATISHPKGHFYLFKAGNKPIYQLTRTPEHKESKHSSFEHTVISLLEDAGFISAEQHNARDAIEKLGFHYTSEHSFKVDSDRSQIAARRFIGDLLADKRLDRLSDVFEKVAYGTKIFQVIEHRDGFKVIGASNGDTHKACVFVFDRNANGAPHLRISRSTHDFNPDFIPRYAGLHVTTSGNQTRFTHLDCESSNVKVNDSVLKNIKRRLISAGVEET